ncbi:hypothetical protein AERO8C_90073 [Aeromonas veronii]|uniref:Uncharacterized protein n=1 Tax=Aeromonas veronii TaxID=654 RepID=A0A653LCK5_AERVE|nr:hypothetical protein AERO8C_90073 [Aeromonas veronii]
MMTSLRNGGNQRWQSAVLRNHQTYVTNGLLDWLLGCLVAWLLGCLVAKGASISPSQVNSLGFRGWAGAEITHSYSTLKKV